MAMKVSPEKDKEIHLPEELLVANGNSKKEGEMVNIPGIPRKKDDRYIIIVVNKKDGEIAFAKKMFEKPYYSLEAAEKLKNDMIKATKSDDNTEFLILQFDKAFSLYLNERMKPSNDDPKKIKKSPN